MIIYYIRNNKYDKFTKKIIYFVLKNSEDASIADVVYANSWTI